MTLTDIIVPVKEEYPDASQSQICHTVNELEHKIIHEVLKPAGLSHRNSPLRIKQDMKTELLLGEEFFSVYLNYVLSFFAFTEGDYDRYNALAALFTEGYAQMAAYYRKKYIPICGASDPGGNLL